MNLLYRNGSPPQHDPLTQKVIGYAIEVHKELGPGFREDVYHRSLELALASAGIRFISEAPLAVKFRDHVVGTFSADLLIEEQLIVELKALDDIPPIAEVQVVSYLKAAGLNIGLILNFGQAQIQIKRKYRTRPETDSESIRLYES
jgi:GxxExxY protein